MTETDKEKRKKQVRHLHQLKSRALADLFKELARSGLSHRLGLAIESCDDESGKAGDDWVDLPPVDLAARLESSSKR